jgi:hypothetical protein
MPIFARSRRARLAAASLFALLAAGCGTAGDSGGWYYHWSCNGDSECLATNPTGQPSGTSGPISGEQVGCNELMTFGTHFWGIPPATQSCDQNPNAGGGSGSAPTITGFSPASTAPGNVLTISGTNFPTAISGITVTIKGVGCTVTAATSTQITCTIGAMGNSTGTVTVTTPGGSATSTGSLIVVNHLYGVTSSGTQSVAVGGNGTVIGSTDGATWRGINPTAKFLSAIAWSGARFTTVGQAGTIVTTSPDGISWLAQTSGTSQDLFGSAWSSSLSLFAAVGRGGVILTSPEGVTWTARTSPTTNTLGAVAWCGAQFIAVGNDGVILTSPNGIAWTPRSSNTTNSLNAIGCSSTFIAVGEGSDATNGGILTSPDGVAWTQRTLGTPNAVFGVVWSGSQFAAVGLGGTVYTSATGTAWTARTSGSTQSLNAVSWSTPRSQFVAVGGFGTILTSNDGVAWTPR